MQLTKELFVIPNGENYILYAPLKQAVAEVNGNIVNLLKKLKSGEDIGNLEKKLDELKQLGIVTEGETPIKEYVPKRDYLPTAVTLIPGLDCNLRCVYCYSNAGEDAGKVMDIKIAKAAIDFVVKNAIIKDEKKVSLVFHGGGEPFLPKNLGLIKESVEYFRRRAQLYRLNSNVSGITNGIMNIDTAEWISKNLENLTISLDGPKDIQNKQRPAKDGRDSFSRVINTVNYLESRKFNYTLRGVITKDSVYRMEEILEFYHTVSPNVNFFTLEPLFECGRCKTTKAEAPDPEEFVNGFVKIQELARKYGKNLHNSCSEIAGVRHYFCGATNNATFFVLPDGDVSSCLEVCRKSDPRADIFIIGQYNVQTTGFDFDSDKIHYLNSRNVENIPNCADCFAKYDCAGDCPARCYDKSGSIFDISDDSSRCRINQGIIKNNLVQLLKGGNKNGSTI